MEPWAIVTLVLGTNAIVSAFSYYITRIQVNSANKRFEKQLERDAQLYKRERRREVRSEPLFKLRAELARMSNKQETVISTLDLQHTRFGMTEEEAREHLEEDTKDWNEYVRTGTWQQAVFALDDKELIEKAVDLSNAYSQSYLDAKIWLELKAEEIQQARQAREKNRERLAEIQSLISERLEEL